MLRICDVVPFKCSIDNNLTPGNCKKALSLKL